LYQLVVLPPPGAVRDVEEFRRLHDPSFHRVAAHLPLVPPFATADRRLIERFDGLRLAPSFDVVLGRAAPIGRALALPVVAGAQAFDALRRAAAAELLPSFPEPVFGVPAMYVGAFGGDAEMELARRAFSTLPPPPPFAVDAVTLLLEDVRGLWHPVRARRLPSSS
jgi:hypothetical protein